MRFNFEEDSTEQEVRQGETSKFTPRKGGQPKFELDKPMMPLDFVKSPARSSLDEDAQQPSVGLG